MGYNKEAAIAAQNAANAAGNIVAALVSSGNIDPTAEVILGEFERIQTGIFNNTFALAGTEAFVEAVENATPAPRGRQGGGRSFTPRAASGGGGGGQADPGGIVLNTGKHAGRTIADVYAETPDYVEWLAESSKNDFLRRVAGEFLANAA